MVLLLNGNSEIGAHKAQYLLYDLCKAFEFIESAVKNSMFLIFKKPIFLHTCATYYELPSNISTMDLPLFRGLF